MAYLTKEKKDKIILLAIGTLAIIAAIYLSLISPKQTQLNRLYKQLEQERAKCKQAKDLLAKSEYFKNKLEEKAQQLEQIEESFATGDILIWGHKTLNIFRSRHENVTIGNIDPTIKVEDPVGFPFLGYKTVTFTTEVKSRYHDFGEFIADFENSCPYFRVKNLDIKPSEDITDEKGQLVIRMEIVALAKPLSKK